MLRFKILMLAISFLVVSGIARISLNLTCCLVNLAQKIADTVKKYAMQLAEESNEFQDRGGQDEMWSLW